MDKQNELWIVVALGNARRQIDHLLTDRNHTTICCDDVYDAIATAVQQQQLRQTSTFCILVDCLAASEMHIFSCLAQMSHITTVAVSQAKIAAKMAQAKLLGADHVLPLSRLSTMLNGQPHPSNAPAPQPANPQPHAPAVIPVDLADDLLTHAAPQAIAPETHPVPTAQPPDDTPPQDPGAHNETAPATTETTDRKQLPQPTLSPAELEALLG